GEFVAQAPATFGAQAVFAIEATHAGAPADGNALLWRQGRAVDLAAPLPAVAPGLCAQAEGSLPKGICLHECKARGAFAKDLLGGWQGTERTRAAPVAQPQVKPAVAQKGAV